MSNLDLGMYIKYLIIHFHVYITVSFNSNLYDYLMQVYDRWWRNEDSSLTKKKQDALFSNAYRVTEAVLIQWPLLSFSIFNFLDGFITLSDCLKHSWNLDDCLSIYGIHLTCCWFKSSLMNICNNFIVMKSFRFLNFNSLGFFMSHIANTRLSL